MRFNPSWKDWCQPISAGKCCFDNWFYQWLESRNESFCFLMTDKASVRYVPWKLHIRKIILKKNVKTLRDRKDIRGIIFSKIMNQKRNNQDYSFSREIEWMIINAREPPVFNAIRTGRSNKKERRVDALALRADEGRDKLRKAAGRSKYPLIRRYPNGETHMSRPHVSIRQYITYGREPGELKHLSSRRKRKKTRFPK